MRHILFATIPTDYRRKRITRRIVNVRKGEENKQMIGLETQGEDPCEACSGNKSHNRDYKEASRNN